jgi:hypothetical protein
MERSCSSREVSQEGSFEYLEDPSDAKFLKICFVCTEEAGPDREHYNNYGGVVCLSCRAFFRRAHQSGKDPKFDCKFGDNCTMTVKTRRSCQKCRHQRCLHAGMNPAAVLTEDQKLIRFRKLLLKNKKQSDQVTKVFKNQESPGKKCIENKSKRSLKSKRENLKRSSLEDKPEHERNESVEEEKEPQQKRIISEKYEKKMQVITSAYKRGIAQIQSVQLKEVKVLRFASLCSSKLVTSK